RRPDGSTLVKVLDFGISKVLAPDRQGVSLTRTSTLMGSPLYMSPEQLRSARDVDYRTDIWSLGVILFELLTRSAPFQAETLPQLIASVLSDVPPLSLTELRPEVPPGLVFVVMRCLERDPGRRFANIGELAHALVPYASRHLRYITERLVRPSVLPPPGVRESGPPGVLPSAPPAEAAPGVRTDTAAEVAGTASAWTGSRHGARPSRAVPFLIAGGVAVLALGLVGAFAMLRPRADAGPEATPGAHPASGPPAVAAPSVAVTPAVSTGVIPRVEPSPPAESPASASASVVARPPAPPAHNTPGSSVGRTPEAVPRSQPAPEPAARAEPVAHVAAPAAGAEPKKNPLAVDLK
ncbi:MAG TPA: protein kinase, partial [Polyangiaceae bacterium]|nr:protein kinase [Polyangiaceae bacterium]